MGSHSYAGPRHIRPVSPRHAKPMPAGAIQRTAAAGGLAAALVAGESFATGGVAGAVTPDTWAKLRACEAGGNYAINTGNGYYGAYQFSAGTWRGMGYQGLPSDAAPAIQDQAAQRLYEARGWQPWPGCSAKLGLVDDRAASRGTERLPLAPVVIPVVAAPAAPVAPAALVAATGPAPAAPPRHAAAVPASPARPAVTGGWNGHYLTTRDVRQSRPDVTVWQTKMVAAGYPLAIDGRYGPQSAAATSTFEAAHGLAVEKVGVVGPQVWSALFK
jgi:peptidoglycan hydrolase-like protein with peptidoglycan-binding domain